MVRSSEDGKLDYTLVFDGPLLKRLAAHLTKGAAEFGERNWMLADGLTEAERLRRSACRHFVQWMNGETDEDHFAAAIFNMNAHEHVLEKLDAQSIQEVWKRCA
jgi:hypothetical protein